MKASMCYLSVVLCWSLEVHAAEVLENAGFESGRLSPWFQEDPLLVGTENWNVTSADAHSGSFSATVVGDRSIRQDFGPIAAEDVEEISFWIKQPSVSEEQ